MRAIVVLAMLLFAASVRADVVKVAESDDTAFYLDPASISTVDDLRRVAVIHDYSAPEPAGPRSRSVVYEIDCTDQRIRSLEVTEYSEPMARGSKAGPAPRESEWMYVGARTGTNLAVRSPYYSIVRFVCSR